MKQISFRKMSTKPCGMCTHGSHKGYLSVKALKEHECLRKQCPYLKKFENHDYWKQREVIKARKKAKKEGTET